MSQIGHNGSVSPPTAEKTKPSRGRKVQGLLQAYQIEIIRKGGKTCTLEFSREPDQVLVIEQHRAILSIAYSCIASAVDLRPPAQNKA
jgi:hypothetical protein